MRLLLGYTIWAITHYLGLVFDVCRKHYYLLSIAVGIAGNEIVKQGSKWYVIADLFSYMSVTTWNGCVLTSIEWLLPTCRQTTLTSFIENWV